MTSTAPAVRRRVPASQTRAPRRLGDRTRARTAMLNQLLLGAVVLIVAIIAFAGGYGGDNGLLFAGVLVVFVATAAAIGVPWNRLPPYLSAVVPAVDIVAILMMRLSSPSSGFGLLWIFPAMWLAASFRVAGLCLGTGAIVVLYVASSLLTVAEFSLQTVLLLFVIVAIATTSFLSARRARVQRRLLDNQARVLAAALARARQQEETLTEVIDAVDFGITRVDADGRISVSNDAHGRWQHAYEAGSLVVPAYGRDGITPLDAGEQPLARAVGGEAFDDEVVWFGPPGRDRRAFTISARRLHDDAGADIGSVVVSRDVTAELVAIRAREDLVASVSHELRTPLTSIVGYLELVLDEDLSASARKGLEVAERNANRLLVIVSDILAASASGHSTVELSIRPESVDVADIVDASVELHTTRAAERGIVIDSSGVESAIAWADPVRIRQVVDNLMSNAVKYNVDGGRIEVGSTMDTDHAWIVVRDNGTGISASEVPRLFDRFFRADAVRKTSTHGSGLGLAISQDIVRSHGGDITVQSTEGLGSTFVVRLPTRNRVAESGKDGS